MLAAVVGGWVDDVAVSPITCALSGCLLGLCSSERHRISAFPLGALALHLGLHCYSVRVSDCKLVVHVRAQSKKIHTHPQTKLQQPHSDTKTLQQPLCHYP